MLFSIINYKTMANLVLLIIIFIVFYIIIFNAASLGDDNRIMKVWGIIIKKLIGLFFCVFGVVNYIIFCFKHFVLVNNSMVSFLSNQDNFKQNLFTLIFKISLPLLIAPILLFRTSSKFFNPSGKIFSEEEDNFFARWLLFFSKFKGVIGYSLLMNGIFFILASLSRDWNSHTIYLIISFSILFGTFLISGALFLLNYNSDSESIYKNR